MRWNIQQISGINVLLIIFMSHKKMTFTFAFCHPLTPHKRKKENVKRRRVNINQMRALGTCSLTLLDIVNGGELETKLRKFSTPTTVGHHKFPRVKSSPFFSSIMFIDSGSKLLNNISNYDKLSLRGAQKMGGKTSFFFSRAIIFRLFPAEESDDGSEELCMSCCARNQRRQSANNGKAIFYAAKLCATISSQIT